jgi:glycerophosphoryl diester phosphodiesterase
MRPRLIAHRGLMARYPENTLAALGAALAAGADAVEFDLQFTRDRRPVLLHDASLARTAGQAVPIAARRLADCRRCSVHEPARLGVRHAPQALTGLREAVAFLNARAAPLAFVEIKRQGLRRVGIGPGVDAVLAELRHARFPWVLISFVPEVLALARRRHRARIGWVLRTFDAHTRAQARSLAPEYLFCRRERLPPGPEPLWPGPWAWAVYDVLDRATLEALAARGVSWFESPCVDRLAAELGR